MANEQATNSWQAQFLNFSNFQLTFTAILILALAGFFYQQNKTDQKFGELFEGYKPSTSEFNRILLALGKSNLSEHRIEDGLILIPPQEKSKYLAAIQENNAVPAILQPEKVTTPNPFLPKSQQEALRLTQKKRQVRDMILRLPLVQEAWFELDWSESNSVYQPSRCSAVVMVSLNDDQALTRRQVATIQGIVGGAFSRIESDEVVVTDANMGISYHDLNDTEESELIELISWKMNRKLQYMERFDGLLQEFPGLQINIEVQKTSSLKDARPIPKITKRVPAKLALFEQEMGLNSTGEVKIPNSVPDQSSNRGGDERSFLSHSSYKLSEPDPDFSDTELVEIHVKVPARFASSPGSSQDGVSGAHDEEELKSKLAARIRNMFPLLTQSNRLNVQVSILPDEHAGHSASSQSVNSILNTYWPLAAILLIGLASIFINRRPTITTSEEQQITAVETRIDPQELENQLTSLIDSDPDAAAKVIKNWIRDAA